jgi:ABC-type sulfate transport system permease component
MPPMAESCASIRRVMRRLTTTLSTSLLMLLVLAPAALAENDGRGAYGATDDKVVTNAGFILIVFFPTFVFVMSRVQRRLEQRKEAGKAAAKRLGGTEWRGGW